MQYSTTVVIDEKRCTGCGRCVAVCPEETLAVVDGKAGIVDDYCLNCGHCEAACPAGAIEVALLDDLEFNSFELGNELVKPGDVDMSGLVRLMASRRSCRSFTGGPVEKRLIEDLAAVASTSPCGSNSQACRYTVISGSERVKAFGDLVITFYERLNRLAEITPVRKLLSAVGQPALEQFYEIYHEKIALLIDEWKSGSTDGLFYGAKTLVVVSTTSEATLPVEDAFLAVQNLMLGAHGMGLGSCVIGFAAEAARRDKKTRRFLELPGGVTVRACIAVGNSAEKYCRTIRRKKPEVRFLQEV